MNYPMASISSVSTIEIGNPSHEENPVLLAKSVSPSVHSIESQGEDLLKTDTVSGLNALWAWLRTPMGLLTLIYGLNVVAWGGMLFLLICKAAPAMCHPSCDDMNSPRQKWIEIDSQILNALFCIPGLGFAPWRARDLLFWLKWRILRNDTGLSRLSEIHCDWFNRVPKDLGILGTPCFTKTTPICIMDTPCWTMDLFVWGNVCNTIFQVCLATCMWSMNRFNRPSWTTGLFVALACLAAGASGAISYIERRKLRKF